MYCTVITAYKFCSHETFKAVKKNISKHAELLQREIEICECVRAPLRGDVYRLKHQLTQANQSTCIHYLQIYA